VSGEERGGGEDWKVVERIGGEAVERTTESGNKWTRGKIDYEL